MSTDDKLAVTQADIVEKRRKLAAELADQQWSVRGSYWNATFEGALAALSSQPQPTDKHSTPEEQSRAIAIAREMDADESEPTDKLAEAVAALEQTLRTASKSPAGFRIRILADGIREVIANIKGSTNG